MTGRANRVIAELRKAEASSRLSQEAALRVLTPHFRPSEVGWVLHHVFGVSMPEATHLAVVAGAGCAPRPRCGPPLLESLVDEDEDARADRRWA